ncbi:hypothetical protein [Actinomycetospora cinnamomea]|uniref:Uncharacterized protein n=1 Tax=Actinomycetospora cinnamomea TaxID=663609 RepID=A0A2U1FQL8_9PSEU|nr:hypothetical protein [Actinomycetospora cinnamomea]PVZ14444.1 hypothetical protein C8D89_101309 [Actinomycetospora cinnamomea]
MGVATRWWRREDTETGVDVWGGPDEVTVAPVPRSALEDGPGDGQGDGAGNGAGDAAGDVARGERERAEREERERAEREREERERAERERAEQEQRERAERERAERERAERERAEREQAEQERREREERERAEREQREQEDRDRAERERVERLQRERAEQERIHRERRERQRAEQERRVAARQEQARREREERAERERREREERERLERLSRVTTVPGAEAVSPPQARDAAAREAAAREAAAADRKRRRHRVLMAFLVAVVAVAAVWIIPRLVALALALVSTLGGAVTSEPDPPTESPAAAAAAPDAPRPELPRGGTSIAPDQRLVALRVDPAAPAEESAERVDAAATPFTASGRAVLPALELPVRDTADAPAAWQRLAVTRAHRQVLLLAVPVGPVGVVAAIAPWERLLNEPDVGLALDAPAPLPPGEVGATTDRLAAIVRQAALPQKLLVVPAADAGATAPAEVALVVHGAAEAPASVLRGVVVPPDDAEPRDVLAAQPDAVLLRG